MTDIEVPKPKPPHISRSLCKRLWVQLAGPGAYLQFIHAEGTHESVIVGMRALRRYLGEFQEVARITVKPGQTLGPEHLLELPFAILREAGEAMHYHVTRGASARGVELVANRIPPPIDISIPEPLPSRGEMRIGQEAADRLSVALEERELGQTSPACENCPNESCDGTNPCVVWAAWAVEVLGLKPTSA